MGEGSKGSFHFPLFPGISGGRFSISSSILSMGGSIFLFGRRGA